MYNNYLYHHGIMGMHWGVKNGPPYPLDYKSHSAQEKRENSKGRLDNYEDGSHSKKATKKASGSGSGSRSSSKGKKESQNKDHSNVARNVAIGVGVVAGVAVTAVVAKKLYDLHVMEANRFQVEKALDAIGDMKGGAVEEISKEGEKFIGESLGRKVQPTFADGSENKLAQYGIGLIEGADTEKGFQEDWDDTIFWSNKNSFGKYQDRHHNCLSNAFAVEMRRRGYDCISREMKDDEHYNPMAAMKVFGKLERYRGTDIDGLEKQLMEYGPGARGIIMVSYTDKEAGKHLLNWEYDEDFGGIVFPDGQQGLFMDIDVAKSDEDDEPLFDITQTLFVRTDNKEPNYEELSNYIEPNLGSFYEIEDRDAAEDLVFEAPASKFVKSKIGGGAVLKKNYKYMKGAYEK